MIALVDNFKIIAFVDSFKNKYPIFKKVYMKPIKYEDIWYVAKTDKIMKLILSTKEEYFISKELFNSYASILLRRKK